MTDKAKRDARAEETEDEAPRELVFEDPFYAAGVAFGAFLRGLFAGLGAYTDDTDDESEKE